MLIQRGLFSVYAVESSTAREKGQVLVTFRHPAEALQFGLSSRGIYGLGESTVGTSVNIGVGVVASVGSSPVINDEIDEWRGQWRIVSHIAERK